MREQSKAKIAQEIDKENNKKDFIISNIENFIEKKNRYIQCILLLVATITGVIYNFVPEEMQGAIRYILIFDIFMEMYVLQAKDSIMQRKINWLSVDVTAQNGGLRFRDEIEINDFFNNAQNDLFLSAISPSSFFANYQNNMEKLLKENKKFKIYILVSSLKAVKENCAEYYGSKGDENHQSDILIKLNTVLSAIKNSDIIKKAFQEGRFLLATSDIVFTTSFVAYDIIDSKINHSKIKVTFYQQGECRVNTLPCVLFDSEKNKRDMYPYFKNIIKNQWGTAQIVKDERELNALLNESVSLLKKHQENIVKGEG